jgi:NAD(P)-dependent dehydrogenase (short-subunit alcohol dehydrogenase family)
VAAGAGAEPFRNPLTANYLTSDDRWIALTCLQAAKYWPSMCAVIGQPGIGRGFPLRRPRIALANTPDAIEILRAAFAQHTLAEWRQKLAHFTGQWAIVQNTLEVAADPQSEANGYLQSCETAEGKPFQLVARTRPVRRRAGRAQAGARVQRARGQGPLGSGHRLGHHRGSQGPRHHRLTTPTNQETMDMGVFDAFGYKGKRALVVGGATGMGAATAELAQDAGAEVVIMDIAEPTLTGAKFIPVNLADKSSIDQALDQVGGPVHALFSCAGVADGTPGIEKINFIGHRHMIDRMLAEGTLPRGSAIGFISSAAGLGWESNLERLKGYLATPDFDSAVEWIEHNGGADYMSTKQTICAYVASQAFSLLKRGVRINAICPGRPTRRWPRPTRRCGWVSHPTTERSSASNLRPRSIRPIPWCSCAAMRPWPSPDRSSSPMSATSQPGSPRPTPRPPTSPCSSPEG